jgi:hypothetical protein
MAYLSDWSWLDGHLVKIELTTLFGSINEHQAVNIQGFDNGNL